MNDKVLVLNIVALTPRLLEHMPRLRRVAERGYRATLDTVLPAVTCTAQSTYLTGLLPSEHGIVGNGWLFRDLGDVLLWRQHSGLVEGERVWETIRRHRPGYRVANVCWWYAMGADVDTTITPRPEYHADGRKEPDCWTWPPSLHDELVAELGPFPLFTFWGPGANIESSKWIIGATRRVLPDHDMTFSYIPHLDYDLQRYGSSGPEAVRAAREVDEALAPLLDDAEAMGATVVVLSEYGITDVDQPVDVNRALRRAGLLHVHRNSTGEILDTWTSRAFAVADHQVAHVYVRKPEDVPAVRDLLAALPGVEQVLDEEGKRTHGLDHPRSGELVLIAEPRAWFTYYYWLDDKDAPDFARLVEIHKKPGYDPVELFMDPADRWVKLRAATALLRKKIGMRYLMDVVPLDPSPLGGSHGRLPDHPDQGPVLLCSDPATRTEHVRATEVRDLLLRLADVPVPAESR
ncbi:nucleotide pyrophosphatase/phosphodiesterase family protein [uncultured Georgenia sp.]|uniref:alkaline phosphatase family protein n=1 Tax=uncultured Georgenia sp. TaxID=378209 RepID=UPI0026337414|nr:nucleotide pyrophosphatase/phosphodiesterase family protein [uncultured Georgenia sp.]